jgi:hypothetical protein
MEKKKKFFEGEGIKPHDTVKQVQLIDGSPERTTRIGT